MEDVLADASQWAASVIEAIAVLVVTYGAMEAFGRLLVLGSKPPIVFAARKAVWRRFGTWLLLGLEFELAADIIHSVISPTWADIGELASIAVIRMFLNYFLERDLERAGQPQEA
jgi:uncharacterized membrane protein